MQRRTTVSLSTIKRNGENPFLFLFHPKETDDNISVLKLLFYIHIIYLTAS